MKIIFGLGNVGDKYLKTRHNIGFLYLDFLRQCYDFPDFSLKKNLKSYISEGFVDGEKVILVKPTTYMNLSGESVLEIKSFYNIDIDNVFVFHDEIDLKLGEIKVKKGGGHNGHNGLKSIDNLIGTSYHRIRMGVDRPFVDRIENKSHIVSKWVLTDFTEIEKENIIKKNLNFISKNLVNLISKEFKCFNNNK